MLRLLVCFGGILAALCVANRPRFWWQELFCSAALLWLPLALLALLYLVRLVLMSRPSRSLLTLGAIGCYGYIVTHTVLILAPYLTYDRWPQFSGLPTKELSGLWIECPPDAGSPGDIERLIGRIDPTIVILGDGSTADQLSVDTVKRYPHRMHTSSMEQGNIVLLSQIPFGSQVAEDLGIEAFPGGVFVLQPEGMLPVEVGVMTMKPSTSQDIFERNRITSRRLASLMRNSHAPRLVAAQFNTTPFSPLMSIYPEQARLRSLMFGMGLQTLWGFERAPFAGATSNVFVSRDFVRQAFERIRIPECTHPALSFVVKFEPTQNPLS
jgi:hypothetical protein